MPHPDKIYAQQLVDFCYESPTAYHAVASSVKILEEHGFKALNEEDDWHLEQNGKYYFIRNDSALMAFIVGSKDIAEAGFKIIGAPSVSPQKQ